MILKNSELAEEDLLKKLWHHNEDLKKSLYKKRKYQFLKLSMILTSLSSYISCLYLQYNLENTVFENVLKYIFITLTMSTFIFLPYSRKKQHDIELEKQLNDINVKYDVYNLYYNYNDGEVPLSWSLKKEIQSIEEFYKNNGKVLKRKYLKKAKKNK